MSNNRRRQTFAQAFANVVIPANINEDLVQQNENPENNLNPVDIPVENPVENIDGANNNPNEQIQSNDESSDDENEEETPQFELTIDNLRDGIVSENTNNSYLGDISQFLSWVMVHEVTWLTEFGKVELKDILIIPVNESVRAHNARVLGRLRSILRNSYETNVVILNKITPVRYMDFILTLTGRNGSRHLSNSSYNNKRAALHHLFRLHNRIGFRRFFKNELGNLFKGLYRTVAQNRQVIQIDNANTPAPRVNNNNKVSEGKEPMSVELYKALCGWLLNYGTVDGIFAYCFLILSWNLSCRAANTANIRFKDISWCSSFDSYAIVFGHSKTDQLGDESKCLRHIYANPHIPLICPVLAIGCYFSSCFNTVQSDNCYLFPGKDQAKRFGKIISAVLKRNRNLVSELGFSLSDLGTHSIRKGAVSYLSSLPGGPATAAICIRAGWTMGKIKDVYMRFVTAGDQFVGRCLCLLPILRSEFGCSPPYFVQADNTNNNEWIDDMRKSQFPMVCSVHGLGRLTKMCLASILYHRHWLLSSLRVNHVFLITSSVLRNGELLQQVNSNSNKDLIQVTFPWTDNNAFSGIPPHIALMQQVTQVKEKQQLLVSEFVGELRTMLEKMGVDGGRMSENNLKNILNNFEEKFISRIGFVNPLAVTENEVESVRIENGKTYSVHYYLNSYKRVPMDWRFPRCGVADLWRHWWIGDSIRQIPPLRMIATQDVKHLDSFALDEEELHGRTGISRGQRRLARKTLNDIKFLMKFVHDKVVERGAYEIEINLANVDKMFLAVADCFDVKERDAQKRWSTVVHAVRSKKIV